MTAKSCGVVYVAPNADHEFEAAFLSAERIKQFCPGLSVTLFAQDSEHPLCRAACFDDVRAFSTAADPAPAGDHLRYLAASPYEFTLYLANDTRLFAPELQGVFTLLDTADVVMVEAAPDISTLRRLFGGGVFDTGFILYRRNPKTAAWLSAWIELTGHNRGLASQFPIPATGLVPQTIDAEGRRELLGMDQTSLAEVMTAEVNRFGLTVQTLPYAWNDTDSRLPEFRSAPPKIRHSPTFLATTRDDMLSLAHAWGRADRGAESERLYQYVADREQPPRPPDAWHTSALRNADLHLCHGQAEIAGELFAMIREGDAVYPHALTGRARIALQRGQIESARQLMSQAASLLPGSAYVRTIEGIALLASGHLQEAFAPLDEAARAGSAVAAFHLGNLHRQLGDPAAAATAYRRTLELDPAHMDACANLTAVLLRLRQYEDAVAAADQLLARQPWHVPALAQKCIAFRELGRDDAVRALADIDRFVVCERLEVPAGFASLEDFNHALGRVLRADPTLARDPAAHATRDGWHTGDLTFSKLPELQALNALVQKAAERRVGSIASGDHPFEIARPRVFRLNSWAVIMDEGGHQIPHIHNSGWLSGVYYVDVPEEIGAEDPEHAGWLVFGRGDPRWHRETTVIPERFVRPEPGLLVTFPSFFWHGTRPLRTTRRRISFAFDIIPAQPWRPKS